MSRHHPNRDALLGIIVLAVLWLAPTIFAETGNFPLTEDPGWGGFFEGFWEKLRALWSKASLMVDPNG